MNVQIRSARVETTSTGIKLCGVLVATNDGKVLLEQPYCTPEISWEQVEATVIKAWQDTKAEAKRATGGWRHLWQRILGRGKS